MSGKEDEQEAVIGLHQLGGERPGGMGCQVSWIASSSDRCPESESVSSGSVSVVRVRGGRLRTSVRVEGKAGFVESVSWEWRRWRLVEEGIACTELDGSMKMGAMVWRDGISQ